MYDNILSDSIKNTHLKKIINFYYFKLDNTIFEKSRIWKFLGLPQKQVRSPFFFKVSFIKHLKIFNNKNPLKLHGGYTAFVPY